MEKYILNISHAVPPALRLEFLQQVRDLAEDIRTDKGIIDQYTLAEMMMKTPEGEEMIILQVHFKALAQIEDIEQTLSEFVQSVHEKFSRKILAFGSIMKVI